MISLKQKIYDRCLQIIAEKIQDLNSALNLLTESANSETKSTAGDKHETARAMMQLEQEKLGKQLKEIQEQKTELEKIHIGPASQKIAKGSLVKTDKGYLFIATGIGKIKIGHEEVIVISARSPLAQKMTGLSENDSAEINGVNYRIEELF